MRAGEALRAGLKIWERCRLAEIYFETACVDSYVRDRGLARMLERQNVLQISQVLFRCLCVGPMVVLPFKDSPGGTWLLNLFDFNWSCLCRHAPVKKQTQCANRAKAFAPHQNLGPAISEAAEPRCSTPSAIKLPDTPRRSEAPPR